VVLRPKSATTTATTTAAQQQGSSQETPKPREGAGVPRSTRSMDTKLESLSRDDIELMVGQEVTTPRKV